MTPIPARCARCDTGFSLFAVVRRGHGRLPSLPATSGGR